ncbi:MAG TPA: prepilin-type N-terminal cleavage/methylation domain-containing protein [Myxococcota bacterium]|nr:prepilin-type N-terminal cleavage/methylation domain-containing protein [Myxococcota bacterium]
MTRSRSTAGFSLIELMVAVAIMGIVTAQLFIVFANQKRVFQSNDRALDVQESARLTLDLISFDTRMAGFMVPQYTAVSSVDGGANGPDRLCLSAQGTAGSGGPLIPSRTKRFLGAVPQANIADDHVTINTADLDMDGDGAPDFQQNAGVIVATETKTYCARIAGFGPAGGPTTDIQFVAGDTPTAIFAGVATTDLRVVPANVYELDGQLNLRRNNLLLASQIEDFEVEFWLDNAGTPNGIEDGNTEFPVNDLNNPDPPGGGIASANDEIRRVRVSVTARTIQQDAANAATGELEYSRPALANRAADPTPDRFRRRSFSASIAPRNI